MSKQSIANILQVIETWRHSNSEAYNTMNRLYNISDETAVMTMNETVEKNMLKMFNTTDRMILESLKQQRLVMIYNQWSHEEAVYNPARAMRPGFMAHSSEEASLVDKLAEESSTNCVFCQHEKFTAEDLMTGRLRGEHCVSAANAFPYAGRHIMVLLDSHHPTQWTAIQLLDMFQTTMAWIEKMTSSGDGVVGKFPMMVWDSLPRAGGSQPHPHIHASLTTLRYPGQMEILRQASIQYQKSHPGCRYFDDMVTVHRQLGLAVSLGRASAIAVITPKKDNEMMVISDTPDQDFFQLIFHITQVFIHDLGQSAFSAGITLPHGGEDKMAAVARLMPRGPISSRQSDISSLDLFASPSISADPYRITLLLQKRVSGCEQNGTGSE